MLVTSQTGHKLDIPDDNIDALIDNGSSWYEDFDGVIEVSEHTEWLQNKWTVTAYKWHNEMTDETHLISLSEFSESRL